MIRIIPASRRHLSDFGWLKTYWLFSFSDYYDPENIQFGALRVFNDDIVQPQSGFPMHPHQEMEIVTVCLHGAITHKDSMGNTGVIKGGDVQRMSAGKGLYHSEFNLGEEPVHFYQIWLHPDEPGLAPSYEQRTFPPETRKNRLLPVASGQDHPDAVRIRTDATIYLADLDVGHGHEYRTTDTRRVFIYLRSGAMEINGRALARNDQARVDGETTLNLAPRENTRLVLIDVPSCKGWGYDQATLRGARA